MSPAYPPDASTTRRRVASAAAIAGLVALTVSLLGCLGTVFSAHATKPMSPADGAADFEAPPNGTPGEPPAVPGDERYVPERPAYAALQAAAAALR